jgi:hypothetical protein
LVSDHTPGAKDVEDVDAKDGEGEDVEFDEDVDSVGSQLL